MSIVLVVGVDPGPVPGIVGLHIEDQKILDVDYLQVNHELVGDAITMLLAGSGFPKLLQVERFVVGARSGRSSSPGAGRTTRDMVGTVTIFGRSGGAVVVQEPAVTVKGWATDDRLARAHIKVPSGMRHAKDAARHALYAAVKHGHLPDPLSSRSRKP